MKKTLVITFIALMIVSQLILISADNVYTQNYVITNSGKISNAQFAVQTLKYEPYPVSAGETFDLWVKVVNIGKDNAKNAQFKILTDYPFSSNDSILNYGIIPGTSEAYRLKQDSDVNIEANQIVMKFQVKVDDNAAPGVNIIKLQASTDNQSDSYVFSLPIQISNTKTDFDVKVHDMTPQESSFVITNIGDNIANAVMVDVKDQNGAVILSGYEPSSLGNINIGEFTIAHLNIVPKKDTKSLNLDISYTDKSGSRSKIEKTISLSDTNLQNICVQAANKDYINWVYAAIGLLTGAFIVILIVLIIQKKNAPKLVHK